MDKELKQERAYKDLIKKSSIPFRASLHHQIRPVPIPIGIGGLEIPLTVVKASSNLRHVAQAFLPAVSQVSKPAPPHPPTT